MPIPVLNWVYSNTPERIRMRIVGITIDRIDRFHPHAEATFVHNDILLRGIAAKHQAQVD